MPRLGGPGAYKNLIILLQFNAAFSYGLPAEFPGKPDKLRTRYITELAARNMKYQPKAWAVAGQMEHTLKKMWLRWRS